MRELRDDVVIRHNNNDIIIWSLKNDCYYVPKNSDFLSIVEKVLERKAKKKPLYIGISEKLKNDLIEIGFDGSVRAIKNLPEAPLDIYFDYTWKCNLNCTHCYNRTVSRSVTMDSERVQHVFREMWKNGIMRVHLAGGEPFIDPAGLENYLKSAYKYGIGSSITCNGTVITEKLCEMAFKYGVKTITFSLDGYNEQTHDQIRGSGSFKRIVNGIRTAVASKRKFSAGTVIQFKAAWSPYFAPTYFRKLILLGIKLGIDVAQFHNPERCIFHKKGYYGESDYIKNYYEKVSLINQLKAEFSEKIFVLNVCNPLAGCGKIGLSGKIGCIGGQELLAVQPNGNIVPCLMNGQNLGNLFNDWGGSLKKFLADSKKLKAFKKKLNDSHEECKECSLISYCRGGSTVRAKVQYGNKLGKDPLCPKSYLEKESESKVKIFDCEKLNHFKQIRVTHSL